eukprot:5866658-Alexandrium_andersonii.AAC.1
MRIRRYACARRCWLRALSSFVAGTRTGRRQGLPLPGGGYTLPQLLSAPPPERGGGPRAVSAALRGGLQGPLRGHTEVCHSSGPR